MNLNLSDFETASYAQPEARPAPAPGSDRAAFLLALGLGFAGALLGGVLYAGFIQLTHIEIGYLSIVIAFLVAKAMMMASSGQGGRPYQISAIVLTCTAVAFGNALMLYWQVSRQQHVRLILHNLFVLMRFGFEEPFLEFQQSATGALLGLFILFIGLRAAWRMTSGDPNAVRHPFGR